MTSLKLAFDATLLREAVFSVRKSARSLRSAVTHYKVRRRHIKNSLEILKEYEYKHGILKVNDENDLSLYRVITYITKAKDNSTPMYTSMS